MDAEITAVASTATTTVVKLLATAGWEQAKAAVVGLWRRAHPERVETVRVELARSRTGVLAARQAGDEQVEWALVGEWSGRLRRLVATDPALADEPRRLVAHLSVVLADVDPAWGATITLRAAAFGSGRVHQAGRDLHVTTGS
jgi:hypothetical protein